MNTNVTLVVLVSGPVQICAAVGPVFLVESQNCPGEKEVSVEVGYYE